MTNRFIDICGASVGLVRPCVPFLLLALAIMVISKGPIFFRQQWAGFGNMPFRILKFGRKYANLGDRSEINQTMAEDFRVTPLVRIVHRTRIDKLQQLVKLLKGETSLVGPRSRGDGMISAGSRITC